MTPIQKRRIQAACTKFPIGSYVRLRTLTVPCMGMGLAVVTGEPVLIDELRYNAFQGTEPTGRKVVAVPIRQNNSHATINTRYLGTDLR